MSRKRETEPRRAAQPGEARAGDVGRSACSRGRERVWVPERKGGGLDAAHRRSAKEMR